MPRKRVIIIGSGFGGLYAARALRDRAVDVLVIDRTNHHLFQPLLYQVATAMLPATDITAPIRWLLRKQRNADVMLAEVERIDVANKKVVLVDGRQEPYDFLIVSAGSRHAYFGHDEWEPDAPGLKSINDAIGIRRRFLLAFERADQLPPGPERDAWMTFVIVGGGPTGVELAGMLPTVASRALRSNFRHIDTSSARVILAEGGPRLLPAFPPDLSDRAARDLEGLGVDVRLDARVTDIAVDHVVIGDEHIQTRTVLWAAGNQASPIARSLGVPLDRGGRVIVESDLSTPKHPEVFVVGDMAAMVSQGKPVPGVAPAAMQSGRAAARNILDTIDGKSTQPFRYRNKGDVATIGRYRAVAVIAGFHLEGAVAWWTWLFIHILYLAGFRTRLSVLVEWGYSFFTYQRGARLIDKR